MTNTPNPITLYVNRKARAIPPSAWQAIAPKPVDTAVQIMQAFVVATRIGADDTAAVIEQPGAAGDYIVALSDGAHIVVPAELFGLLFSELGASV